MCSSSRRLISPTSVLCFSFFFFFNDTATTEIYTLSLHDALPILGHHPAVADNQVHRNAYDDPRSEEHTSELQSRRDLVCRLLLEKKKQKKYNMLIEKKKNKPNNIQTQKKKK